MRLCRGRLVNDMRTIYLMLQSRVKVPIKDKCPGCNKDTVDLSLPAFKKLEKPEVGRAKGAQVKIVNC